MHRLGSILSVLTFSISLASCELRRTLPSVAVVPQAETQAARKTEIREKLAPRCGTATKWSPVQKRTVASVIEKYATDPGVVLLAGEWRRQKRAIETCRGAAS